MTRAGRSLASAFALLMPLAPLTARAESSETLPAPLVGVGIEDRPGAELPLDIELGDQDGQKVRLSSYFDGRRPVIIALAYYECPMLCSLVLKGFVEGISTLREHVGPDFRVLVVSIDPRDDAAKARAKREAFLTAYGRPVGPRDADFLVGAEEDVGRLAKALGFGYRFDPETKQYAHAAGIFVSTPDGRLSRTLYGVLFPEKDLKLALAEASGGRVGGAISRVLLFCFHWDPAARGYVLATIRLMKAGGALTLLVLGLVLYRLWRSDPSRRSPEPAEAHS